MDHQELQWRPRTRWAEHHQSTGVRGHRESGLEGGEQNLLGHFHRHRSPNIRDAGGGEKLAGGVGVVSASGAECGFRGVVWASGPRFVGWACPRLRFRPEGPFSVSPGRSPGWQGPQKSWFLGLKGRFQGVCCFRLRARGFQTLTRLALPKPVLQACGRGGHVRRRDRMFGLCSASVCDRGLKRRFPVASGAAIVMPPFAGVMVQKIVPPHRPPLGQRPYTT